MGYSEPTGKDIQRAVNWVRVLLIIAASAPLLAVVLPKPGFLDLGNWFGRSGAVTTVFALLAEVLLIRAKISITGGLWRKSCNSLRTEFLPKFGGYERLIFVLTVAGTIIWAYGDVPFSWIACCAQATCSAAGAA